MLQATLRPKAAIVSKQYIFFAFSHTKAYVTKFDLGVKWVKVSPGHNLNNFGSTCIKMLHTKFQGHWSTGSGEEDF